jgi:predicted ATPase
VCLERTVPARRQRWHRSIAEHLERTCADRIADVAHVLAMHFDLAQLPARAVHYYMAAGQLTARRFASADALVSYERALELLPRVPSRSRAARARAYCTMIGAGAPLASTSVVYALTSP